MKYIMNKHTYLKVVNNHLRNIKYNAFQIRIGLSLFLYLFYTLSAPVVCERETNRMTGIFLFETMPCLWFYLRKSKV